MLKKILLSFCMCLMFLSFSFTSNIVYAETKQAEIITLNKKKDFSLWSIYKSGLNQFTLVSQEG